MRGETGIGDNKDFTPSQRDAITKFLGLDDKQTAQNVGKRPNQFGGNVRKRGERIVKEYRIERMLSVDPMNHPLNLPISYFANKTNYSVNDRQDWMNRLIAGQDLKDEVGRNAEFKSDGTVVLYHGTSPENAQKIREEGLNEGSFLSGRKREVEQHIQQHKNHEIMVLTVDPRSISYSSGN